MKGNRPDLLLSAETASCAPADSHYSGKCTSFAPEILSPFSPSIHSSLLLLLQHILLGIPSSSFLHYSTDSISAALQAPWSRLTFTPARATIRVAQLQAPMTTSTQRQETLLNSHNTTHAPLRASHRTSRRQTLSRRLRQARHRSRLRPILLYLHPRQSRLNVPRLGRSRPPS